MSSCLSLRRGASGDKAAVASPSSSTPPPPPQDENQAPGVDIGLPYDLKHPVHIHYNFAEARFEGVPDNLDEVLASGGGGGRSPAQRAKRSRTASASAAADAASKSSKLALLHQQFGLPFRQVPRVAVAGYDERVPAVLVMLRQHLLAKRGHLAPHIFRESPSSRERDAAVRELDAGAFAGARHDVRVLADLIKLWFRALPTPILHELPPAALEPLLREAGPDLAAAAAARLGALERSVLLWLADLLALVAAHEASNHMGVDQLAIVMAPNLVRIETPNPSLAVARAKAAVELLRAVLRARLERRLRLGEAPSDGLPHDHGDERERARAGAASVGAADHEERDANDDDNNNKSNTSSESSGKSSVDGQQDGGDGEDHAHALGS